MERETHLSIVIPAYNEATRIGNTLEKTLAFLEKQDYRSELIVVSDGSRDGTGDLVREYQREHEPLKLIEYHPNRGKGGAVKEGMLAAVGDFALFMDADYAVPIEMLDTAFSLLEGGCDVAIGSRGVQGAHLQERQGSLRELAGKVFGRIQNLLLKLDFVDSQCGFKLFTREAVDALFPQQRLDSVIFDGEILFLARRAGFGIGEFAVEWHHDQDSRITYNLTKSLKVFGELLRVRWVHRRWLR